MRRTVSALLGVLVVASLVSACSPRSNEPEPLSPVRLEFTKTMSALLNSFPGARVRSNDRAPMECNEGQGFTQTLRLFIDDWDAGSAAIITAMEAKDYEVEVVDHGIILRSPLGSKFEVSNDAGSVDIAGRLDCHPEG